MAVAAEALVVWKAWLARALAARALLALNCKAGEGTPCLGSYATRLGFASQQSQVCRPAWPRLKEPIGMTPVWNYLASWYAPNTMDRSKQEVSYKRMLPEAPRRMEHSIPW
jgi:hypothetical protein